jgi:hypothetical protein
MNAMQFRLSGHRFSALFSALAISASLVLEPSIAQADIHLLAPSRSIDPAMPLRLSLMLTAEDDSRDFSLPDVLRISLTPDLGASTRLELIRKTAVPDPITLGPGEFLRIEYVGAVPAGMRGRVRIDTLDLDAPAMLVRLSSPRTATEPAVADARGSDNVVPAEQAAAPTTAPVTMLAVLADDDPNLQLNSRLSAFEPMFFAGGYGTDANAQVQLSFKLRLHEPVDKSSREVLHNLYFGYTQPAYWDLTSDSKPFVDTNYMPSFFYYIPDTGRNVGGNAVGISAGYVHESNGRDGEDSRSLDVFSRGLTLPLANRAIFTGRSLPSFTPISRRMRTPIFQTMVATLISIPATESLTTGNWPRYFARVPPAIRAASSCRGHTHCIAGSRESLDTSWFRRSADTANIC